MCFFNFNTAWNFCFETYFIFSSDFFSPFNEFFGRVFLKISWKKWTLKKKMHVHFATHDKNLKVIAFQTWALKHLSQTKHKCIILKKTLFKIKEQCWQLFLFYIQKNPLAKFQMAQQVLKSSKSWKHCLLLRYLECMYFHIFQSTFTGTFRSTDLQLLTFCTFADIDLIWQKLS